MIPRGRSQLCPQVADRGQFNPLRSKDEDSAAWCLPRGPLSALSEGTGRWEHNWGRCWPKDQEKPTRDAAPWHGPYRGRGVCQANEKQELLGGKQERWRMEPKPLNMGCGQEAGPGLSLPSSAGEALAHHEALSSRPMSSWVTLDSRRPSLPSVWNPGRQAPYIYKYGCSRPSCDICRELSSQSLWQSHMAPTTSHKCPALGWTEPQAWSLWTAFRQKGEGSNGREHGVSTDHDPGDPSTPGTSQQGRACQHSQNVLHCSWCYFKKPFHVTSFNPSLLKLLS